MALLSGFERRIVSMSSEKRCEVDLGLCLSSQRAANINVRRS